MKKTVIGFILGILTGLSIQFFVFNETKEIKKDLYYDVVRVVDGDTIVVKIDDEEEKVRLLCIDTPERGQKGYKEATNYLRQIITNKVKLEYDGKKRGAYGRLLAYVWLKNGNMANIEMIKAGHTAYYTKYGKGKYKELFENSE